MPDAAQRIERYGTHLLRGKWRDPAKGRVCGTAALVDGAMSRDDCIALGNWPDWLPAVVITLLDNRRIKQVEILGGWFVVTGPHATPISSKFGSRAEAQNWLSARRLGTGLWGEV